MYVYMCVYGMAIESGERCCVRGVVIYALDKIMVAEDSYWLLLCVSDWIIHVVYVKRYSYFKNIYALFCVLY